MEGERIAKSLSVYHEKYKAVVKKNKSAAAVQAPDGNNVPAAATNLQQQQQQQQQDNLVDDRRRSVELVKKLVPARKTDGKMIPPHLLNDYTSESVRKEQTDLEGPSREMRTISLCPFCQGGEQDNPKEVTAGIGNVMEKWEFLFRALQGKKQRALIEGGQSLDDESKKTEILFTLLNRCDSFEDLTPEDETDLPGIDSLTAEDFAATLNEGTEKLVLHGQTMTKLTLGFGEVKSLLYLLSSMVLARNKLRYFGEEIGTKEKKDPFQKSKADLEELISAIIVQLQEYYVILATTVVLHDGESQDWMSAKPYYEGERISANIQFWGFHMQGLRVDFYNILPPSIAKRLLQKVLAETLGCLTFRYTQVNPSMRRLPQYRADLTAILLIAYDLLLSTVDDGTRDLFHPSSSSTSSTPFAKEIHAKCSVLAAALTVVGCPIQVVARTLESEASTGAPHQERLQPLDKSHSSLRLTQWMHLLLPGIYSATPDKLNTPSFIHVMARMSALQPGPNWPLLVRLCLSRNLEFPQLVIRNFGAFVPGITGGAFVKSMREGCGNLFCTKRCLGTADIFWPQAVGSGILYVVMHGNAEKNCLVKVLEPLLRKLSPNSWDVLHVSVMWNVKKPVWFQALLDLLEPYFHPILDDLMDDVESGRTWTLAHVPEAIKKLNSNIMDIAHLIPPSFYQICELIESLLPDDVRPVCDSVVAHIFISCIYGIINKLIPVFRDWRMQREKIDFLVAVGEKLCNLDSSPEMQKLEGLTDASAQSKTEKAHKWDGDVPEEFIHHISVMVADQLLSDPMGQESMKAVYRFVTYNSEWIQRAVGVTAAIGGGGGGGAVGGGVGGTGQENDPRSDERARLMPWGERTFKELPPGDMNAKIGSVRYSTLFDHPHAWEESLRHLTREANPSLLIRLLRKRPEAWAASAEVGGACGMRDDGAEGGSGAGTSGADTSADAAIFKEVLAHFQRGLAERTAAA